MLIFKNNKLVNMEKIYNNQGQISFNSGEEIKISDEGHYVLPGFIDQHIHGAGGYDTMDNSKEAIIEISRILPQEGTTSFLPTTMTYDLNVIKEVLQKVYEIKENNESIANIIGVHLEGPFISGEYIGAQNSEFLQVPNKETLKKIDPNKIVKLVTYAPELDKNDEFLNYLVENDIVASVGHSGATCNCVREKIEKGLMNFTHLYNAMSPIHHRTPGVVAAAFEDHNAKAELIVDGIHLHPDIVKMTYEVKGHEQLLLVTDAMRAKQMGDGEYDLGGQKVIKKGNEARLENGALAGSVLLMNNAVKNFIDFSKCTPEESFKMASYNVAEQHKLNNKGLIAEGYDFDITVLDKNFNVVQTFVGGKEVYNNK